MKDEGYQEFEGHIYLDISNPFVAWNVSRGGFVSADILFPNGGFTQNSIPLSPWSESRFRQGNEHRLESEIRLETLRQKEFPEAVSRLSGIFVFRSIEDLAPLWALEGWGGHFEDTNLADCGVQANAISRLDSNWITEIMDGDGRLASDWQTMARQYWSGDCLPGKTPIWETIVSGGVTIWGTDLKARAQAEITRLYPQSSAAIWYSRIAFEVQSLDGVAALVAVANEDYLEIDCRFRFVDGQNRIFRCNLSRGKIGMSNRFLRFPKDLTVSFPPITNRVSSESSYRFSLERFIRDPGLFCI
jgi:hypothetical protein